MTDGVKMRSSMRVRGVLERGFAVAIVGVACGARAVAAQGGAHMFTSRATLDVAVNICLADDPTGGCICANIPGGCGEAGSSNLPQWDVRGIADFSSLFQDQGDFDQDLNGWVVDDVRNMNGMFKGASAFTHDLNTWDTSGVTDMRSMFQYCGNFDGDINGWNTGAVTDMSFMFDGASQFNKALSEWDTSAVTDMNSMFQSAFAFFGDVARWNTAAVKDMSNMFNGVQNFNQGVDSWNTGAVTDMSFMFENCEFFQGTLSQWDVSRVQNFNNMFSGATNANPFIVDWNTASATSMASMFYRARTFNMDITGWNCQRVVDATDMFYSPDDQQFDPMSWYFKFLRLDNSTTSRDGPPTDWYQWCSNAAGTYASIEEDCVPNGPCPFPERCLAGNVACEGSTGTLCGTCLDGYYKSGDSCFVCPDNSAAMSGIAGVFVVLASYIGFKAAAVLGPVSANMIKKIVDSLQFFNISFEIDIEWPTPIQKLASWVSAFNFNIELVAPECAGMKLSWYTIFWSTTFFVPVVITALFAWRARFAQYQYDKTVEAIRSESDGERTMYWIARRGFCGGERRALASENGDKIIKALQKQYAFGSKLRKFATLVLTVLYLPIVRAAIQAFDCVGESDILIHDVDVNCSLPQHYATQAYAGLVVMVFGGGFPLYIYRKVRKIRVAGKLDDAQTLDTYGSLYEIYRREELTRAERLEIKNIAASAVTTDADTLRRQATLTRAPTRKVELDAETRAVVEKIAEEERAEEEEEVATVIAEPTQKASIRKIGTFKSMMKRSASSRGRDRAQRMRWVDVIAVNFLTFELAQKFVLVMVSSVETASAGTEDRWGGILFVHVLVATFIFFTQPWRIVTLGFGSIKVNNALNRVEFLASVCQGLVLLIGANMDESSLKNLATGILFTLIIGMLFVRVGFLFTVSVTNKMGGISKWDFSKTPEETMNKLAERFVELALEGSTVGIYALKGAVIQLRSKTRARLESTREAMLKRVADLKASGETDEQHINALYAIANEMAHAVNFITVADYPKGPSPQERVDAILATLDKQLIAIERDAGSATAAQDRFKAYDDAVARAKTDMLVYARAEAIPELSAIAQGIRAVVLERDALSLGLSNAQYAAAS